MLRRRDIEVPPPSDYADALEKAWTEFGQMDIERLASNAVARYDRERRILKLPFLNEEVSVEIDSRKLLDGAGQEVRTYQAILVLHYLVGAKPAGPTGTWLTFREFDGGRFYYSAFESRSIGRIVETFGSNVELLKKAAERLGGEQVAMGDVGARFDLFPKVPVLVIVWQGDAELSPSANILFDSSAGTIFSTEDLTVVAGLVAGKLVKQARELS